MINLLAMYHRQRDEAGREKRGEFPEARKTVIAVNLSFVLSAIGLL
jgi:hypothetical protein